MTVPQCSAERGNDVHGEKLDLAHIVLPPTERLGKTGAVEIMIKRAQLAWRNSATAAPSVRPKWTARTAPTLSSSRRLQLLSAATSR
jgi:hypothetical protein